MIPLALISLSTALQSKCLSSVCLSSSESLTISQQEEGGWFWYRNDQLYLTRQYMMSADQMSNVTAILDLQSNQANLSNQTSLKADFSINTTSWI